MRLLLLFLLTRGNTINKIINYNIIINLQDFYVCLFFYWSDIQRCKEPVVLDEDGACWRADDNKPV